MIRKWSKKISQKQHEIKNNKTLQIFGEILHRREFWNLNRSSVSKGVAIGIFWAFVPVPFQMVFSTMTALIFGGNIAIAVSMVWITNPLTMPVIFYLCYKLGAIILGRSEVPFTFEASLDWMIEKFDAIMVPLLTGSLLAGICLSFLSFFLIKYLWFISTKKEVQEKNKKFKIFD